VSQFACGRPLLAWLNPLLRSNLLRSKLHTKTPGLKPIIVVRLFAGLKARASTKMRFHQNALPPNVIRRAADLPAQARVPAPRKEDCDSKLSHYLGRRRLAAFGMIMKLTW
jgi:hypothetical protein